MVEAKGIVGASNSSGNVPNVEQRSDVVGENRTEFKQVQRGWHVTP